MGTLNQLKPNSKRLEPLVYQRETMKIDSYLNIKRPGVAGAVLQTPLSLII